jgi:carbonic anhydrase
MNCENPINISDKQVINKCSTTCSYVYDYNNYNALTVERKKKYLKLDLDGIDKISINKSKSKVTDIRLYQPSIHHFDGKQADAEIIIEHESDNNNITLVCIPILKSDGRGLSIDFFRQIIRFTNSKTQSINVNSLTLNDIVPSGGFYYYNDKYPYEFCETDANVIVFGLNSSIKISSKDLTKLQSLISPTKYNAKYKDVKLYKNENGKKGSGKKESFGILGRGVEGLTGKCGGDTHVVQKPKSLDGIIFIFIGLCIFVSATFGVYLHQSRAAAKAALPGIPLPDHLSEALPLRWHVLYGFLACLSGFITSILTVNFMK